MEIRNNSDLKYRIGEVAKAEIYKDVTCFVGLYSVIFSRF